MSDPKPIGVILLVEDEPLVRLVAAEILMEAHFRVIEAADAEEALTVLKAEICVDVLLSDVEMPPGMDGFELAWQVHRIRPWIGLLIASGRQWPRENDLPPGAVFLAKPYSQATLLSHVRAAVETAKAARARTQNSTGDAGTPVPRTA
ncbi:response regulator [Microvirga lotononidis]|uniref:Response regulator with CheY-like receiver, AAA-type ATPase, and DNA-binding domains n=1 Tax=Microvirga lotononidis TaxID=864069 RepID=I4YLP9_9HYPH|nr:response regulator [Microvirga lotononidis]EIM24891.1 response regulator with CheY-like receiver, AAA-type ATPase, and DNA-binding domains [Microvirga lotononidis]WQO29608.1 response regulator [Microvirga lotononidis]